MAVGQIGIPDINKLLGRLRCHHQMATFLDRSCCLMTVDSSLFSYSDHSQARQQKNMLHVDTHRNCLLSARMLQESSKCFGHQVVSFIPDISNISKTHWRSFPSNSSALPVSSCKIGTTLSLCTEVFIHPHRN